MQGKLVQNIPIRVAPFTGAWIEIQGLYNRVSVAVRRTLHGCVD